LLQFKCKQVLPKVIWEEHITGMLRPRDHFRGQTIRPRPHPRPQPHGIWPWLRGNWPHGLKSL